ncbi:oligopeptide ABC transporter substrate-binding protein, partial [Butyricicoccus sp. 1XD8-22]
MVPVVKENNEPLKNAKEEKEENTLFDLSVSNEGTPIKGGMLKVALVKDEPFKGVFLAELNEDSFDSDIMSFASNSIFEVNGDFLITNDGIASMVVDQVNNKVTIKIREDVKWSDGEPLKIEDLIL